MNERFEIIPRADLRPFGKNPRRHYDEAKLGDLTDSIKRSGVLTPLVVWPRNSHFEVLAGNRRLVAAERAAVDWLPCVVREYSEVEALEVATIENLQREDPHPLEEAAGYGELLATGKYDVAELARRVGKSEPYVYGRLKLRDLAPVLQDEFYGGRMRLGHALLLAKLTPLEQVTCWQGHGDYEEPTVNDLKRYIEHHVLRRLDSAPFSPKDAKLVPEAGACTTCPRRTGANPSLFGDFDVDDSCSDGDCWERKVAAVIEKRAGEGLVKVARYLSSAEEKKLPADVLPHSKWCEHHQSLEKCEHLERAVVVAGHDLGKTVRICRAEECPVHARGRTGGAGSAEDKAARKREIERLKKAAAARDALMQAIVDHTATETIHAPGPRLEAARLIARALYSRLESSAKKSFCRRRCWEPVKRKNTWGSTSIDYERPFEDAIGTGGMIESELRALAVEMALWTLDLTFGRVDVAPLKTYAASIGLNAGEIEREAHAAIAKPKKTTKRAGKASKTAEKAPSRKRASRNQRATRGVANDLRT